MNFVKQLIGFHFIIIIVSCTNYDTETQKIAKKINQLEALMENKKRRTIVNQLTDDFSAKQGRYDKKRLNDLLLLHFLRNKNIRIILSNVQVTLHANQQRAISDMDVLVTGASGLIPHSAGRYGVSIGWRKIDDDWLMNNIEWLKK